MNIQPAEEQLPEVTRRDVIGFAIVVAGYLAIGIFSAIAQSRARIGIGGAHYVVVAVFQVVAWPLALLTH